MLFRTHPEVAVGPAGEFAQFDHFGVRVRCVVFDGEAAGVVDAHVGAETVQDSGDFVG